MDIFFCGRKKAAYFLSVFFALLCVACAIAPYILIADIVKKLLSGVRDWNMYFHDCAIIAAFWLGNALDMPSGSLKSVLIERIDSMETTLAHILPEWTSNLVLGELLNKARPVFPLSKFLRIPCPKSAA